MPVELLDHYGIGFRAKKPAIKALSTNILIGLDVTLDLESGSTIL